MENILKRSCIVLFMSLVYSSVKADSVNKSQSSKWFVSERWHLSVDCGLHFKSFQKKNLKDDLIINSNFINNEHGKDFWGESGILFSYGLFYKRILENKKFFWASKIFWTYFYPDTRWYTKGAVLTLASIPLIGKLFKVTLEDAPSWIEMLLVPIVCFDFGYITSTNFSFSLGTVYLWGLNFSFGMPISDKFHFEVRTVFFLDRFFEIDFGIHSFFINFGINYSLKNS